jgi:hypothetical protein
VTVWEPQVRLVFEWRAKNFAPAEKTEVEVGDLMTALREHTKTSFR